MNARPSFGALLGGAVICGAIVAGCSGGSTSPSSITPTSHNNGGGSTNNTASTKTAPVTITVTVPIKSTSSTKRAPRYVSPSTSDIVVYANTVSVGGFACPPGPSCSGSVQVPIDTTSLEVQLTDNNGAVLSEATQAVTIIPGTANSFGFTFDGVATSLVLSATGSGQLVIGIPASIPITITPQDADHNPIAFPGNIIDSAGNVLIGAAGSPQTVSVSSDSANVTIGPLTWQPGSYTLTGTATYDGGDPGGSEQINLLAQTSVGGDGTADTGYTFSVVPKAIEIVPSTNATPSGYTVTVLQTALPTYPPAMGYATSIEFGAYPSPAPITVHLAVTADYPVSGTVHVISNSCESTYDYGTITSAFASGVTYSNTTPGNFTVTMQAPTPQSPPVANQTCSFTIQDPVTQLQTTATFGFDYYSVYVQGKGRK